jgi:septal ring factor EnvC (AmiA/AmiB activator)
MYNRIVEFPSFILGSLRMSDAVIALISAMMTTIGLAMVNKLMSRPSEHWRQASEMREELRKDLSRAQEELSRLRDRNQQRDIEFFDIKEQMINIAIELRTVSNNLHDCLGNHRKVETELQHVRAEFMSKLSAQDK